MLHDLSQVCTLGLIISYLYGQISLFTDHRQDTEKRMGALIEERDALQSNQEELQGRVHMLERQLREQAQQVYSNSNECIIASLLYS